MTLFIIVGILFFCICLAFFVSPAIYRSGKRNLQTPTIGREIDFGSLDEKELEEEFASRCAGRDSFGLHALDRCNFGFGYHCVMESKSISPALTETLKEFFARTYTKHKHAFMGNTLTPQFNRLTHILIAMDHLGMLTAEDKMFWIQKYCTYLIDPENFPFAQNWNRVWFFIAMGIDNIAALPSGHTLHSIYVPSLKDIEMQDCFNEGPRVMLTKFVMTRSFFNQVPTREEREALQKLNTADVQWVYKKDIGDTRRFYKHLIALSKKEEASM